LTSSLTGTIVTSHLGYAEFMAAARSTPPEAAFVLGSGLGEVARRLKNTFSLPFAAIPELTATTVSGHRGCLTLGEWAGKQVLVFEGRLHYYEGHAWGTVTAPVQLAARLGVRHLVLTNAAGGIADFLAPQSLMAVRDHVEFNRPDGWRTPRNGNSGVSAPSPYSFHLLRRLQQAAQLLNLTLHEGLYAAVTGPNYETPAEIRALKQWGAAAVGMSTSREINAGRAAGLECAAISCITNRAAGLSNGPINHQEVLVNAGAGADRLADLLEVFLEPTAAKSRL
jgi:purine-nucleoside phosphorylase